MDLGMPMRSVQLPVWGNPVHRVAAGPELGVHPAGCPGPAAAPPAHGIKGLGERWLSQAETSQRKLGNPGLFILQN